MSLHYGYGQFGVFGDEGGPHTSGTEADGEVYVPGGGWASYDPFEQPAQHHQGRAYASPFPQSSYYALSDYCLPVTDPEPSTTLASPSSPTSPIAASSSLSNALAYPDLRLPSQSRHHPHAHNTFSGHQTRRHSHPRPSPSMSITPSSAPHLLRFQREQNPEAYGGPDSLSGPGDVGAAAFYGEAYEDTYAAGQAVGLEPGPDYPRTRRRHDYLALPSSSASSSRSAPHHPTLAPAPAPEAARAGGGFPKRVAGTGTTTYPVGGTDVHAHGPPDIGSGSSQSASRELRLAERMTFGPMPPALPLPSGHVLGRDGLDSGGGASHPDAADTLRLAPAMYKSDDAAYPRSRQDGFDIAGVPPSFSPRPPTLAEMAIQYNDPAALQPQPLPLPVPHPLPRYPDQDAFVHEVEQEDAYDHTGMAAAAVAEGDNDDDSAAFNDGREKRHACTMCHKRFDRPSTLKKHLLVHTGEKAFQCSICDRRFGVLSNLNRHVRRCSQREVHLHGPKARIARTEAAALAQADRGREAKRGLGLGGTVKAESASTTTGTATAATPKRRRRPPSPSRWVPPSLRTFRLLAPEDWPASSLPLEPVSPIRPSSGSSSGSSSSSSSSSAGVPVPFWPNGEDRDSYDENVGQAPYRSDEYDRKKRLPGPAAVYGVFGQGKGKNTGRFGGAGAGGNQGSGRREVVAW